MRFLGCKDFRFKRSNIKKSDTMTKDNSILWTIKIYDTCPPYHISTKIEDKPVEQHVIRNDNLNHFSFRVKSEKLTMVWFEITRVSRTMKVTGNLVCVCIDYPEDCVDGYVDYIIMDDLEPRKGDIVNINLNY